MTDLDLFKLNRDIVSGRQTKPRLAMQAEVLATDECVSCLL